MVRLLAILTILLGPALAQAGPSEPALLKEESGVEFRVDESLQPVSVQGTPLFEHQYAWRSQDGLLELRIALRPLKRLEVSYEDPHSSAPEPNHIFPLVFDALVGQLARAGSNMPSREFAPAEAMKRFNADWASAAVFDVEPQVSGQYRQALLLALHRNNVADVYLLFLVSDLEQAKALLNANLEAVRFVR